MMEQHKHSKFLSSVLASIIIAGIGLSLIGPVLVFGQPPAPTPISPAEGDSVITPTFSWLASSGAVYYEVQVGPQSDPNLEYWSDTTYNLNLTPNDAHDFPNEPLYWRVRAYDSGGNYGPWSSRINFTKYIPAPPLRSPPNHVAVSEPALKWDPVRGAAYYKVQVSTDPTFNSVDHTYTTYNTSLTPSDTIAHGTWYWRVLGVDADGHEGTPSASRYFVKHIPAPVLLSPADGITITTPSLAWQAADGAAYYKVDVTTDPTFNSVDHTYTTYNTSLTPEDALDPGTYYWRVRGVDADGHEGTNSAAWSFVKRIPAPVLVSPADGITITTPSLAWQATDDAAYYKVDVTTDPTFNSVDHTYTTYNTSLTPKDALDPGTYYWRVRGVDADGHEGTNSTARSLTLASPPAPSDTIPQLQTPAEGEIIATNPTFRWTRVVGAADYCLRVSTNPTFDPLYDSVYHADYTTYTPYTPGYKDTYADGTYYWKVEARDSAGTVIATSEARSFTKQMPLPLLDPPDGATLWTDPTFGWTRVVGAKNYRLRVSTSPTFDPLYDSVYHADYTTYTPYTPGYKDTYADGTYYWKVEAQTSAGTLIATSEARSFTKQTSLPLTNPINGATLWTDPTFSWARVVGAKNYRLRVSTSPTFDSTYDYVYTDYTTYTPYTPGYKYAYADGTYYWKVEARDSGGTLIATSQVYSLTKSLSLPLLGPPDGATLGSTPTFSWEQVVGAKSYRLWVSTDPAFDSTYDYVRTDYTTYTPYTPGYKDTYADGTYYWKVEARDSGDRVIATSLTRTFTKSSTQPTSTPIGAPTATPTRIPTNTPVPTATPIPGATPTPPGPNPTAGPPPTSQKTLGNVTVYADTFTDLGDDLWQASGHIRLGSSTVAYVELSAGVVDLDYGAQSIVGSSDSAVSLLMDDGTATPVFAGPFSVDPSSGEVTPLGVIFQLARLGDLGVDTATPLVNFGMNVLQGTVSGRARITVYPIEDVHPSATVNFTLHHDGHVSGDLGVGDLAFQAAGVTFAVENATLSYDPASGGKITIGHASVVLPDVFSVGSEGSVENLMITESGLQRVGGGSITLSLPDMNVPGTGGKFELARASVTLSLEAGGKYCIHGKAGFSLPNIASTGKPGQYYSGGLYAEFELDQTGLRYVLMGGTIEPGIPIGNSGMALTGLEGEVTLRPEVRVQITGTIESELEVPPLGPVVSGEPSVWVKLSSPYEVGISGSVQVLIFDAADASLVLSQSRGLYGEVHITYPPYALNGDASLHVWRSGGEFHFTGSATVTLGFEKGALGTYWGIDLPPSDLTFGNVGAEFGEFCHNSSCSSTIYGFKGAVDITIHVNYLFGSRDVTLAQYAFFLDVDGNLDHGSSLDQYRLIDQATMLAQTRALGLEPASTDVITYEVSNTDLIMVGMDWQSGSPELTLVDPEGVTVTTDTDYPGMGYTNTVTSTVYLIENPKTGIWQAHIGNLTGSEDYSFGALGRNLPPTVTVQSVAPAGENLYTIHWMADDADPEATLALYYDTDDSGADGRLIAQGLDPAAGSYVWDASQVQTGDYYVYARIDDLKNMPVVSYFTATVSVVNTQPPAAPTGVKATASPPWRNITVCWDRNTEADVVGYNVYYGRQSGTYDLGLYDATNVTCFDLPLPPWMNVGYVAVTAYDNSGNESPLSEEVQVTVERVYKVYLPLVLRGFR